MGNRKDRRESAKRTAKWERELAARMASTDRRERLKQRLLSAAREDELDEDNPGPGSGSLTKPPAAQFDWMPLQAIAGLAAAAFPAYIVAEAAMGDAGHPLHWVAALIAGAVGYLGGLALYKRRGY